LEMTSENFARLLRGLTIAVGKRRKRVLLYQFLAAEIRALHCSYGLGDGEFYKRGLTFLENCERYTLRTLVRRSAKHHAEVTVDHAKRVFLRALKMLDSSQGHNPTLRAMMVQLLKQEPLEMNGQPFFPFLALLENSSLSLAACVVQAVARGRTMTPCSSGCSGHQPATCNRDLIAPRLLLQSSEHFGSRNPGGKTGMIVAIRDFLCAALSLSTTRTFRR
jgi:hypothetical protein